MILLVQSCRNCQGHRWHSTHSQLKYRQMQTQLKQYLSKHLPHLSVVVNDESPAKPYRIQMKKPRVGAFEIQLGGRVIFSKLQKKKWPSLPQLLNSIQTILESSQKNVCQDEQPCDRFYLKNSWSPSSPSLENFRVTNCVRLKQFDSNHSDLQLYKKIRKQMSSRNIEHRLKSQQVYKATARSPNVPVNKSFLRVSLSTGLQESKE